MSRRALVFADLVARRLVTAGEMAAAIARNGLDGPTANDFNLDSASPFVRGLSCALSEKFRPLAEINLKTVLHVS